MSLTKVTIAEEVCKGCGLCVDACPKQVLALADDRINAKGYNPAQVIRPAQCIGCAMCAVMCPDSAITVEK
ncbi:MAG: 4Fe-4S binding protein [Oscillospiraceae bacterium]